MTTDAMPTVRRMGGVYHPAGVAGVFTLWLDPADERGAGMITLGFFFVMLIGPTQVAMGPYADEVSCYEQAQMMERAGETVPTVCYQTLLPSPDSTVELERDSQG